MRKIKRKEEGVTGIGKLMIFIAIVLVAAAASRVLVETVHSLQQQGQKTGEQTIKDVSTAFKFLDISCINYENFGSNEIEEINIKVGLYGGSSTQDLHQTLIHLRSAKKDVGLKAAADVEKKADDNVYGWEPLLKKQDIDYESPYVEQGDLYKITMNLIAENQQNQPIIGPLKPQETIDIRIIPKHGTSTYEEITIPSTMYGSSVINTRKDAVQLDFSDIYNSDTIVTGSEAEDGINKDDDGTFDEYAAFITQSVAEDHDSDNPKGLPDDGIFGSDENHSKVDLDWSGKNTWTTNNDDGRFTTGLPDGNYDEIHIFTSAGGGGPSKPANYTITLNYADDTTQPSQKFTTPDWFNETGPPNGYFLIDGMDRWDWSGGIVEQNEDQAAIFGHNMAVDNTKTLESVTIEITEMQAEVFGFFGGIAELTGS